MDLIKHLHIGGDLKVDRFRPGDLDIQMREARVRVAASHPTLTTPPVLPPFASRLRTTKLEALLRARLALLGFIRGAQGSGVSMVSRLHILVERRNGALENHGLVSTKMVTNAGVGFLVDDWDNGLTDLTTFNFHGAGTSVAAEALTDVALGSEVSTALNPDSTRAIGIRSQPAFNQYRSIGTLVFDGPAIITEHGLFSVQPINSGVLWDRSVFSAIGVDTLDSIQFTYTVNVNPGG